MTVHYPPPNNPKVCKISLLFHRGVRTFVNVMYFSRATDWDLTSMVNLVSMVKTWYDGQYKTQLPSSVGLYQIQARKQSPTDPVSYDFNISPDDAGSQSGTAEAGNVTLTLSWRTGLAGRAYRGRNYIPGLTESSVAGDDTIASTLVAALSAIAINLITTSATAGTPLVVFHRPRLIAHPLDNTFTTVITSVIENIVDSQRRRLPNRGR